MKTQRSSKAIILSFGLHLMILVFAILPMVSMVKSEMNEETNKLQYIEIAFENGEMSPGSASVKPAVKKDQERKQEVKEKAEKINVKKKEVVQSNEILEEDDSPVVMEEGKAVETEEIVEIAEGEENLGETDLSDSDSGEGDTGDAMTGTALANMDFEGEGVFGRKIIYHANISKLAEKEGRVVVNLCIDRSGRVSHVAFNRNASTLVESEYVTKVMKVAAKYRFEEDYKAPKVQCGKLSFIFMID